MNKELAKQSKTTQSIKSQAVTATVTGSAVDTQGYESALILVDAGTWTDGTHTFSVTESDDDSTYTTVAAADLVGSMPTISDGTGDDQMYEVAYLGTKRYIKVVDTVTGAASPPVGLLASAHVVLSHARHKPQ